METDPTPFDLNQAIQQWRETLGQSAAFRSDNLDELETHLRDSVACLAQRGLTTEEGFLIASRRLGGSSQLGSEFGKINVRSLWLNRALWMLIGVQGMSVINALILMLASGATTLAVRQVALTANTAIAPWIIGVCSAVIQLLTFAIMLALAWRLLLRKSKDVSAWFRAAPNSPGRTLVLVGAGLAIWLIPEVIQAGASAIFYKGVLMNTREHFRAGILYGTFTASYLESIALIVLTLLLARRQIFTKTKA